MQAWAYARHGSRPTLQTLPRPPAPAADQVLVRVRAASVNPIDHVTASGAHMMLFSFKWPRVYGFDFSGEVAAVGANCAEAVFRTRPAVIAFAVVGPLAPLARVVAVDVVEVRQVTRGLKAHDELRGRRGTREG